MARPLRIEFPGAVYHITSRGNERKALGSLPTGPAIPHRPSGL
jgi:hypothetical protein